MSRPILKIDRDDLLVLEAPRAGSSIIGALALVVLLVVWGLFPDHRIAQGIFALLALVGFAGLLHVHRLELDLPGRAWAYRDGWAWSAPRAAGTFDDLAAVQIEANTVADGLVGSKLRSRIVFLVFDDFPVDGHDGRFPLGFPMGPHVAAERAAEFAARLGVPVLDLCADDEATGSMGATRRIALQLQKLKDPR